MKVAASPRPRILEPRLRLPVWPFSPVYAEPTMASADFCEPFKIPYGIFSRHRQVRRPPRVRTAAFPPHPPHLLHHHLMVMGFALSRKLAQMIQPDMRFVFLRSAFCLRLPSDPTSRWTPLPLANSFHHQDLQGTCTPKLLPMPGTRKLPPTLSVALSGRSFLHKLANDVGSPKVWGLRPHAPPLTTSEDLLRFNSLGEKLSRDAGVSLMPIAVQTDFAGIREWELPVEGPA